MNKTEAFIAAFDDWVKGSDPPLEDAHHIVTDQAERWRKVKDARSAIADLSPPQGDSKPVADGDLFNRVLDQFEADLKSAHAEICKLQGLDPATHKWPEWTPQANSLRWIKQLRADPPSDSIDECIKELPEGWSWTLRWHNGEADCLIWETKGRRDVMGEGPNPLSAMRAAVEGITK